MTEDLKRKGAVASGIGWDPVVDDYEDRQAFCKGNLEGSLKKARLSVNVKNSTSSNIDTSKNSYEKKVSFKSLQATTPEKSLEHDGLELRQGSSENGPFVSKQPRDTKLSLRETVKQSESNVGEDRHGKQTQEKHSKFDAAIEDKRDIPQHLRHHLYPEMCSKGRKDSVDAKEALRVARRMEIARAAEARKVQHDAKVAGVASKKKNDVSVPASNIGCTEITISRFDQTENASSLVDTTKLIDDATEYDEAVAVGFGDSLSRGAASSSSFHVSDAMQGNRISTRVNLSLRRITTEDLSLWMPSDNWIFDSVDSQARESASAQAMNSAVNSKRNNGCTQSGVQVFPVRDPRIANDSKPILNGDVGKKENAEHPHDEEDDEQLHDQTREEHLDVQVNEEDAEVVASDKSFVDFVDTQTQKVHVRLGWRSSCLFR